MKRNPTVSWLLPVKNGMPYLTETLASIRAQTFTDYEVLAWLVTGSDGSREELDRWIPTRLPGRIIETGPIGIGSTLNRLVSESNAEFCARLDSDDVCEPDRLARQIAFLRTHPDIALVGSGMRTIDAEGGLVGVFSAPCPSHTDIVYRMLVNNAFGHPSVIFRREAVLSVGNYTNTKVEDYDLWLRLACPHRLAVLPEFLVKYRLHEQSATALDTAPVVLARALDTLAAHSQQLYGLTAAEVRRLHGKAVKFVLWPAIRVACHLRRQSDLGFWEQLRNPSFIDTFRFFRQPYDLVSLFALALLDRRKGALRSFFSFASSLVVGGLKRRLPNQNSVGLTP